MDLDRVNHIMTRIGDEACRWLPDHCEKHELRAEIQRACSRMLVDGELRVEELIELFAVLAVETALPKELVHV